MMENAGDRTVGVGGGVIGRVIGWDADIEQHDPLASSLEVAKGGENGLCTGDGSTFLVLRL